MSTSHIIIIHYERVNGIFLSKGHENVTRVLGEEVSCWGTQMWNISSSEQLFLQIVLRQLLHSSHGQIA